MAEKNGDDGNRTEGLLWDVEEKTIEFSIGNMRKTTGQNTL
jgi:hypothetical protein